MQKLKINARLGLIHNANIEEVEEQEAEKLCTSRGKWANNTVVKAEQIIN